MGAFVYLRDADFNRLIDLPELGHITQGLYAQMGDIIIYGRLLLRLARHKLVPDGLVFACENKKGCSDKGRMKPALMITERSFKLWMNYLIDKYITWIVGELRNVMGIAGTGGATSD